MSEAPKTGVVKLEQAELILIMIEALDDDDSGRPEGVTAAEILDAMNLDDELRQGLKRAADNLVDYFVRCMNDGGVDAQNAGFVKEAVQ